MSVSPSFKDLEEYGLVGNLETCALIGRDGSVDWLCFPWLESSPVFAALLDCERGGYFTITPATKFDSLQVYEGDTNILRTTFSTPLGSAAITDFMPVKGVEREGRVRALYRRVEGLNGETRMEVSFRPRFNYGSASPRMEQKKRWLQASWDDQRLFLHSAVPMHVADGCASAVFKIPAGKVFWFVVQYGARYPLTRRSCEEILGRTRDYWAAWAHKHAHSESVTHRLWHTLAVRSGLVLKLLANPDTGAIAAASTTSLPECPGGTRNWDYRYAWIRDSSYTSQALYHLGYEEEAREFRRWVMEKAARWDDPSHIPILYPLHGEKDLTERISDNLSGYRGAGPVRIGNDAQNQVQLDIYGELVNAIYETTRYGDEISAETWGIVCKLADYVCSAWEQPDRGIWEVRHEPQQFVHSKVMCWVALDRALRMVEHCRFETPVDRWAKTRDTIHAAVIERGFDGENNTFVREFDGRTLDAATLQIPLMGFLPADDPRVIGTIDAVLTRLTTPEGLVFRYEGEDGLPGREGAFFLCSFWLINALTLAGRLEEAEELFAKVLKFVSPLGLLSEEVDPQTGKQLGNFPQAFSHIGLINSALYLGIAGGKEHKRPAPFGLGSQPYAVF